MIIHVRSIIKDGSSPEQETIIGSQEEIYYYSEGAETGHKLL